MHIRAIEGALEATQQKLKEAQEERNAVVKRYQDRNKKLNTKTNRLTNVISDLRHDIDDLKDKLKVALNEVANLREEKKVLQETIKDIPNMTDKQKGETIRALRVENRKLKKDLAEAVSVKSFWLR